MGWIKIRFPSEKRGGVKNRDCPLGHKKRTDFFKRSILRPLDKIGPNSAEWYLAYSFQIFPHNHPMKLIPAAKTIGPINSKANADKSFIFI